MALVSSRNGFDQHEQKYIDCPLARTTDHDCCHRGGGIQMSAMRDLRDTLPASTRRTTRDTGLSLGNRDHLPPSPVVPTQTNLLTVSRVPSLLPPTPHNQPLTQWLSFFFSFVFSNPSFHDVHPQRSSALIMTTISVAASLVPCPQ